MIDGLVVVDKPPGWTSHDVVARCRRIFSQRRVGHAGTLDPDATGVLLVGLGRATRLMRYLSGLGKTYTGELVLGVATSTLDASGEVTGRWDMSGVTLADVQAAAQQLTGPILQVPPMVSALKVGGKRLHQLAREGQEVERAARAVTVERFELAGVPGSDSAFTFVVECSSGTYVRTLAADLGGLLGGGAHLRTLRRQAVGGWTVADSVPLERLGLDRVVDMAGMLRHLDRVALPPQLIPAVRHGKVLEIDLLGVVGAGPWALLDEEGALLAVYQAHGPGLAKPTVVVAPDETGSGPVIEPALGGPTPDQPSEGSAPGLAEVPRDR